MKFQMITGNPKIDRFIKLVWHLCEKRNIKLVLSTQSSINFDGFPSGGCFDDEHKILAVALGNDLEEWLKILVHESCHMDQWFEGTEIWNRSQKVDDIFKWIGSKRKWSKKHVNEVITAVRDMELDCEKRTVKKILKYNLPFDVKKYEIEATSYCLFYTYMAESRKWYKSGAELYRQENMEKIFKKGFNTDFTKLTVAQRRFFKKCV